MRGTSNMKAMGDAATSPFVKIEERWPIRKGAMGEEDAQLRGIGRELLVG